MTTATISASDRGMWVSGLEARRIAGVSWYRLHTACILNKVRTLAEPGQNIRYHRDDLVMLAKEK